MSEARTYSVTGYSGGRTVATVTVEAFDRSQRVRRALKGIATWWAAALGSIFIPVAHFLLVPSLALFGVYTFFERLGAAEVVTAAQGVCPDCGREQQLDVSGRWRVPRDIACRYCQRSLRLSQSR
ncbi:MAG TPA: hypothetical protein VGJ83_07435 [Gemmatimonadales bacterium]|jgi:hypothetical protein